MRVRREVKDIETQYASGLLTQGEKYNKVIDIWSRANDKVSKAMMERLSKEKSWSEATAKAKRRRPCRSRSTPCI